jgi:flagellar hook assembly protein FlgD
VVAGTSLLKLAQLTQVEQAYNTNSNLKNLLAQGNNGMALAAVSFIGKQVEAAGSTSWVEAKQSDDSAAERWREHDPEKREPVFGIKRE